MRAILNAKNGQNAESPIFIFKGFKWYLKLYPNGRKDHAGQVQLFLVLASKPDSTFPVTKSL